jgi:heptosyltransferase-2
MTGKKYKNLLIIQPMVGIGDMLWFLPHIRAIVDQFSEGGATLLARPSSQAKTLFQKESCIKYILPLHKKQMNKQGQIRNAQEKQNYAHDGLKGLFKLASDIRQHKFDAAWILDRHPEYAYACKLAGIPKIHGYGYGFDRFLIQKPTLSKQYQKTHARDRATQLLQQYTIDITPYEIPLKLSPESQKKIAKDFPKNGKWACFGIGSSELERKWPSDNFAKVISALSEKKITCFICGGSGEAEEAKAIKKAIDPKLHKFIHSITHYSVMETAALVSKADLYIGNDTFLYNLAALQGVLSYGIGGVVPVPAYLKTMRVIRNSSGILHVSPQEVLAEIAKTL